MGAALFDGLFLRPSAGNHTLHFRAQRRALEWKIHTRPRDEKGG
jgi:hypothetical protein